MWINILEINLEKTEGNIIKPAGEDSKATSKGYIHKN